jgi:predicted anti-sigma-YlaC factor YlaD
MRRSIFPLVVLLSTVLGGGGCSVRGYALRSVADALSAPGGTYGSDDDPELVRNAAPFGLKTMEQLAESLPEHRGIRLALASGFAQYAYAFVNEEGDRAADKSMQQAQALWLRARRLYLRARDHALFGLEIAHPGTTAALRGSDQAAWKAALDKMTVEDVPLVYWTAASWGLAVSTAKDDANLIGDLPEIDIIMQRALALDEAYDEGAIHEFYVSLDSSRSEQQGGGAEKARKHLERSLELSKGRKLGAMVAYAESVLVPQQKKKEFVEMLQKVVQADIYSNDPAWKKQRLANIVARERARWLLAKQSELFAE